MQTYKSNSFDFWIFVISLLCVGGVGFFVGKSLYDPCETPPASIEDTDDKVKIRLLELQHFNQKERISQLKDSLAIATKVKYEHIHHYHSFRAAFVATDTLPAY